MGLFMWMTAPCVKLWDGKAEEFVLVLYRTPAVAYPKLRHLFRLLLWTYAMFGAKYLKLLWPPPLPTAEKDTGENIGLLAYFCFIGDSHPRLVMKD